MRWRGVDRSSGLGNGRSTGPADGLHNTTLRCRARNEEEASKPHLSFSFGNLKELLDYKLQEDRDLALSTHIPGSQVIPGT